MTINKRKAEKLKLSKQREMDGYKELDIPTFYMIQMIKLMNKNYGC